jgi:hypothetical protein
MATVLGILPGSIYSTQSFDLRSRSLVREYFVTYVVQTASLLEREITVMSTPGIPVYGQSWIGGSNVDIGSRLVWKQAREIEPEARLWHVETRWTTELSDEAEEDKPPEFRTPEWRWDSETMDYALLRDAITGDSVTNSAGDVVPVSQPVAVHVLTITRYKVTFDVSEKTNYENRTNTAAFWGFGDGKCWLSRITDDPESVDGRKIRRVGYTIRIKDDEEGWKAKPLDYGPNFLDDGTKRPFLYDGVPGEGRLNGSGAPSTTDVFLDFARFKTANLNDLDLGPYV